MVTARLARTVIDAAFSEFGHGLDLTRIECDQVYHNLLKLFSDKVLVSRLLERLKQFYMIDLLCDEELQPFYASFGMHRATGMFLRNYERQAGSIG